MYKYYVINKPFNVLSQFSEEKNSNKTTLKSLYNFPTNVYPVGRLDSDSEGLLIITDDKNLNFKVLNPSKKLEKTYYVQVEGLIHEEAISKLQQGVEIKLKNGLYKTKPCKVSLITPDIKERIPPIRERKNIPTSWIKISIYEGKNRQVRKMTSKVGFPTLRLIRTQIGRFNINELNQNTVQEYHQKDLFNKLF
jgi:23S rRNA pseudouridine2457 synthase